MCCFCLVLLCCSLYYLLFLLTAILFPWKSANLTVFLDRSFNVFQIANSACIDQAVGLKLLSLIFLFIFLSAINEGKGFRNISDSSVILFVFLHQSFFFLLSRVLRG